MCVCVAVVFAAKPNKTPRAAISVTKAAYTVLRAGEESGFEKWVRTVYNDNTIEFDVDYQFFPAPGMGMVNKYMLLLREETRFPVEYSLDRRVISPDDTLQMHLGVDMYANVAEITSGSATTSNAHDVVVPTGAAIMETGVVFVYEPLLFWYDRDLGGRQNFEVLEPASGRPLTVSMQYVTRDTITVNGVEYATDLYLLERENFDVKLYVDADDRLVRVDQNYMMFDLADWTREGGE